MRGIGKPGRLVRTLPAHRAADRAPNPIAVSERGRCAAVDLRTLLGRYVREAHPPCYGPNFEADQSPRRLRRRTRHGDLERVAPAAHARSRDRRADIAANT